MTLSKFILELLQFIACLLVNSMRTYENSGDVDADGIPFSKEYYTQSFLLAALRDCVREVSNAIKESEEDEK